MKWYPLLTLPMFIFMGYMLSESRIADDLYRMFHVWMGPLQRRAGDRHDPADGGDFGDERAVGGRHGDRRDNRAAGTAQAGYDNVMVTGVIQGGSAWAFWCRPRWCWCFTAMIARQPVGQLWLAGVFPGPADGGLFILYIAVRCKIAAASWAAASKKSGMRFPGKKYRLAAGRLAAVHDLLPDDGPFVMGWTSLVESSAIGRAGRSMAAAFIKGRMTREVMENVLRKTLGISCMFMWIILAALCFGAVFDGLGAVRDREPLHSGSWGWSPGRS
jgi:TRAP-type mannitol/chloroaromatic compound transport system permease large subunit